MRALLLVLALAGAAHATPLIVSNFAARDDGATTANDSLEFAEADGGGSDASEDADVRVQSTTIYSDEAGGSAATFTAMQTDLAANEARYYELFTTAQSLSTLSLGFGMHVDTAPGVARTIAEIRMTTGLGCFVKLNTDRTLSVYYNTTGTSFGTSGEAIEAKYCTGDTQTPCDADGDCPTTCSASCAADGTGCFWAGVELVQINFPAPGGDQVTCELWINGRASVTDLLSAASLGTITNARLGGTQAGEAGTLAWYAGYVVADDSDRAHFGWVGATVPAADGTTVAWTDDSCSGTPPDYKCVNDWTAGGLNRNNANQDNVRASVINKTEEWQYEDVAPGTLTVGYLQHVIVGKTNGGGSGTVTWDANSLTCESISTCASPSASTASSTSFTTAATGAALSVLHRFGSATSPSGSLWTTDILTKLGLRVRTTAVPASVNARMSAAVAYVFAQRTDAPLQITLLDHNIGVTTCTLAADCCASGCLCENGRCTKDAVVSVALIGDSTAGGTLQSTCEDSTPCSVPAYCANIAPATKDIPSTGCTTDAECATCTLRRTANGGAGYPCTSDANCGDGTCASGTCSQNDNISCTVDADCEGYGTCDEDPSGAEGELCIDSCPGQPDCPSRTGWPGFVIDTVNADVMFGCGKGGETLHDMVSGTVSGSSRLAGILVGDDTNCSAVTGTGACECTGASDCGSGGVCTAGACTAGDATRTACTAETDCVGSNSCLFAPPDYVVVLEGVNDVASARAPECREPEAFGDTYAAPGYPCSGPTTLCVSDATCDTDLGGSVSPTSQCLGDYAGAETSPCMTDAAVSSTAHGITCDTGASPNPCACSIKTVGCIQNTGAGGCNFSIPSSLCRGTITAGVTYQQGFCGCTTDAQCGDTATWKCVGSMCRRKCTTDANCSTPTRTGACDTGNGVCQGRCSTPCDRTVCTKDTDCPKYDLTWGNGFRRTTGGTCSGGRCSQCGPQMAARFSGSRNAFLRWNRHAPGPLSIPEQFRLGTRLLGRLSSGTTARPLLIPATVPEYSTDAGSLTGGWADAEYLGRAAEILRNNTTAFPHVIDIRKLVGARTDQSSLFTFFVHLTPTGAEFIGNSVGDYLATLNVCATGSGRDWAAQRYCKNSTGTFSSTECTTSADCSGTQTCQTRPCTGAGDCPNGSDSCRTE
jgi:hypothetical protein